MMVDLNTLEREILQAASENSDHLQELLQVAIEYMVAQRSSRLLDKVLQIMSENLRDARDWKD